MALAAALVGGLVLVVWIARGGPEDGRTVPGSGVAAVEPAALEQTRFSPEAPANSLEVVNSTGTVFGAGTTPTSLATGRLVVHVMWATDHAPAASVGLTAVSWDQPDPLLAAREGFTDADGRWEVSDAPPGRVTAFLDRADGGKTEIRAGETTQLELVIPAGVLVRGQVVDIDERAVSGADVWLTSGGNNAARRLVARCDADGRFALRDVRGDGGCELGSEARGHTPSALVRVSDDGRHEQDVTLRLGAAGTTIAGRVVDGKGAPVPDALVLVGPEGGWPLLDDGNRLMLSGPPRRLRTDAQGAFTAHDIPPGTTPIAVRARGYSPWAGQPDVLAGPAVHVEIVLPASAVVEGVVSDEDGWPVVGARVSDGHEGSMEWVATQSGADGRFALADVTLGSRRLTAALAGKGKDQVSIEVEAGARLEWNPRLDPGLQITGRVLNEDGRPVAGHHVIGRSRAQRQLVSVQGDTDGQGRFVLCNCDDGEHDLEVYAPDWRATVAKKEGVRPGPDEVVLQVSGEVPPSAYLIGRVLDAHGLVPEQTTVAAADPQALCGDTQSVRPDTGEFRLGPLVPGEWELWVLVARRPPWRSGSLTLVADETRDLGTIELPVSGRIALRVVLPEGAKPEGLLCVLAADSRPGELLKLPDPSQAVWVSSELLPGDYEIAIASNSGGQDAVFVVPIRAAVHVDADTEARVELVAERGVHQLIELTTSRLDPPQALIRVTDAAGNEVRSESAQWDAAEPGTSPLRDYTVLIARPGSYVLRVECEGQVVEQRDFSLTAGTSQSPVLQVVVP